MVEGSGSGGGVVVEEAAVRRRTTVDKRGWKVFKEEGQEGSKVKEIKKKLINEMKVYKRWRHELFQKVKWREIKTKMQWSGRK